MKQELSSPITEDTLGLLVHAYNNYLSGVMGFTELALLDCEQTEVKNYLDLSLASGNEAILFGKQLLSMIGRLQVILKPLLVSDVVRKLTEKNNLNYDVEVPAKAHETAAIKTDLQWFVYCLHSIIEFAQTYLKTLASKHTEIKVSFTEVAEQIIIQISAPLELSQVQARDLFNPFYSSRTLLGKKEVGLAMVKGFIGQMQGDIAWESERGFVLSLPKCRID